MREEKREKDKGREKEGQKTTKSEMEKVISSPQPQARRGGFGIQKTPRSERRRRFGLKAERPYLAVIGLRL